MRILVTFAVDAEFAPWRKIRKFQRRSAADVDYFSTQIADSEINIFLTGMGGKSAWLEAATSLYDSEIDVCISSGLAGALRPEYKIGEVLVAEKVLAAQRDLSALSEPSLVESAVATGAKKVHFFYTADHVVLSATEKHDLGAFADAVEMESCGVLVEAGLFAARGVAIRAISDTSKEDLPLDFNKVTNDSGVVSVTRILGEVVSAPGSIPALIRFGQRSRFAGECLANFLERYLQTLAVESHSAAVGPVQ
jgi:adenosylhomocysteine/aminodeoxyfutalosine nucleosidase